MHISYKHIVRPQGLHNQGVWITEAWALLFPHWRSPLLPPHSYNPYSSSTSMDLILSSHIYPTLFISNWLSLCLWVFRCYSWQCSGLTACWLFAQRSLLTGLEGHMGFWRLKPHQLCLEQIPYLLDKHPSLTVFGLKFLSFGPTLQNSG